MTLFIFPSPSDYLSVQDAPAHLVIQGLLETLDDAQAIADVYRTALQGALATLADRHQDALRLQARLDRATTDLARFTATLVTP